MPIYNSSDFGFGRMESQNSVTVRRVRLSDGSHVYNVAVHDGAATVEIPAVTQPHAWKLAEPIAEAFGVVVGETDGV